MALDAVSLFALQLDWSAALQTTAQRRWYVGDDTVGSNLSSRWCRVLTLRAEGDVKGQHLAGRLKAVPACYAPADRPA